MPATEHSEFDSLVMYARRKIVSASDMFSIGWWLDVGMACLTVLKYVVSVYVLMFEVRPRIIFIDKYLHLHILDNIPLYRAPSLCEANYVNNVKKSRGEKKTKRAIFAIIYYATEASADFATALNHGKDMSSS
jgi:hypothetical protein